MTTSKPPPLLSLPRELRDRILDYILAESDLAEINLSPPPVCPAPPKLAPSTKSAPYHPVVTLYHNREPRLLLLCRQFYVEVQEHTISHMTLSCRFERKRKRDKPMILLLWDDVPRSLLKTVKRCVVDVQWEVLFAKSRSHDPHLWLLNRCWQKDTVWQSHMKWTPSKALRRRLQEFLKVLQQHVSESAEVVIVLRLDGYPDPDRPYAMNSRGSSRYLEYLDRKAPLTPWQLAPLVHIETIFSLEIDADIAWPAKGALEVKGLLLTPLFSTRAKDGARVRERMLQRERGEAVETIEPDFQSTRAMVLWELEYTGEAVNYRGLMPKLLQIFPKSVEPETLRKAMDRVYA